jgi:hypothetical protein
VPHQVQSITVRVDQLPDGRWRLYIPRVEGWGAIVRSPVELASALRNGFQESQLAAHADWRGHAHDANLPTYRRHRPTARSRKRCDVYHPTMWKLDPEQPGVWISPKGLRFPEERQAVQNVMKARQALGLPARPDPVNPDPIPAEPAVAKVTSMTARNVAHLKQRGKAS